MFLQWHGEMDKVKSHYCRHPWTADGESHNSGVCENNFLILEEFHLFSCILPPEPIAVQFSHIILY